MQIKIHNLTPINKFVYYINYKQMFPTYLLVVCVIAAIFGLIGSIWLDEVIRNKNSLKNRFIPVSLIAISTGIMLFQLGFIAPSLMKLPNSDLVE